MRVLIDGYNVLKTNPQTVRFLANAASLEQARRMLITRIANAAGLRKAETISLVFDGHIGGLPQQTTERHGRVTVIYSKLGESADTVIKRMVAQDAKPGEIIVITLDREIKDAAQSSGASVANLRSAPPPVSQRKADISGRIARGETGNDDERDSAWERNGTRKKGPAKRAKRSDKGRRDNDLRW